MSNIAYIIPGSTLLATFSLQRQSELDAWRPTPGGDISLVGQGFEVARNTTGLFLDLYYQDNVSKSEEILRDRVEFMKLYLNWPIVLGNRYAGFLHDVLLAPTGPQQFGYIHVYLRTDPMSNKAMGLEKIPSGPFRSLVAITGHKPVELVPPRGLADGVIPIEWPKVDVYLAGTPLFPVAPYPTVKFPQAPAQIKTPFHVESVSVQDAQRTSDGKVFIESSSVVTGVVSVEGNTRLNVGANVTLGNEVGGSSFRLVSIDRDKSGSSRLRLEQTLI